MEKENYPLTKSMALSRFKTHSLTLQQQHRDWHITKQCNIREKLTVISTLKLFKGTNRQSVMNSDCEEFWATSAIGA